MSSFSERSGKPFDDSGDTAYMAKIDMRYCRKGKVKPQRLLTSSLLLFDSNRLRIIVVI